MADINLEIQNTKNGKTEEVVISKIKEMIINNELEDWESSYRGMLLYKYALNQEEIDLLKTEEGRYKDFSLKVPQNRLFDT